MTTGGVGLAMSRVEQLLHSLAPLRNRGELLPGDFVSSYITSENFS